MVELSTCDDAAVYRITDDIAAVFTVDFFTPLVDDAYEFGRIAVTNALSDIYAMGGKPVMALNLVAYPTKTLPLDLLHDILRGGADQAAAAGVSIVGGHSIDDPEPKYGMAVMGLVNPNEVLTNSGAKPGDRLILTKPLGTGVVATAIKHDTAPPAAVAEAVRIMTTLNAGAARAAKEVGCSACTDITGFGLLGHLREMAMASGVGARVRFADVPLIDGLMELIRADEAPGGTYSNLEFVESTSSVKWPDGLSEEAKLALCDAQTAGGLLLSVPPQKTAEMLAALQAEEVSRAVEIGEITPDPDCRVEVVL